jgi:hypothetical protein
MSSQTETETTTKPSTSGGDHDRFAHYVDKNDSTRAYITGEPVKALCGKVWVPSRDPKKYKVCPTCAEIFAFLHGVSDS